MNVAGPKDPPKEHQFKPGQSGNPTGYSRGRRMTDALIRVLDEKDLPEKIAKRLSLLALEGDIRAITLVFDRVDGKPREAPEETQADDGTKTLRDFLADPDPPKKGKKRKADPAG